MTKQLIIIGDSLVDAGNTTNVMAPSGINPFEDPIYAQGGNVKASDGLVLGEFIAVEMGGTIKDAQLISILSSAEPKDVQVHNYAHAGARTDSSPLLGEQIGIGIKEQLKSFVQRKDYYRNKSDVDVILSGGGNDIRDAFDQIDELNEIVSTKKKRDDNKLASSLAKPIARNMIKIIRKLDAIVDEIAVAGAPPIMETPEAQDWLTNFAIKDQIKVSNVIDLIGKKITRRLQNKFQNNSLVVINDGYEVWNQLDSPSFVDNIHPDAETASEISKIFVSEMTEQLNTFGF